MIAAELAKALGGHLQREAGRARRSGASAVANPSPQISHHPHQQRVGRSPRPTTPCFPTFRGKPGGTSDD